MASVKDTLHGVRVALISDTHLPALIRQLDGLGPEIATVLAGVDLILHAGDVTAPSVLDWLEQFAPVLVARGNNDDFDHPRIEPGHRLSRHVLYRKKRKCRS